MTGASAPTLRVLAAATVSWIRDLAVAALPTAAFLKVVTPSLAYVTPTCAVCWTWVAVVFKASAAAAPRTPVVFRERRRRGAEGSARTPACRGGGSGVGGQLQQFEQVCCFWRAAGRGRLQWGEGGRCAGHLPERQVKLRTPSSRAAVQQAISHTGSR